MEKMDELIKLMEDEIAELQRIYEKTEQLKNDYYNRKFEALRGVVADAYYRANIRETLEGMKNLLAFYYELKDALVEIGIKDINEKIFLTDNVYLSLVCQDRGFYIYYYFDNDRELYDRYYSSHSELNSWICATVERLLNECWGGGCQNSLRISSFDKGLLMKEHPDDCFYHPIKIDTKAFIGELRDIIGITRGDAGYERPHSFIVKQINLKLDLIKDFFLED